MIVLDASVTLAWCFEDERTPAIVAAFAQVVAVGAVVPSLWRLEVANSLHVAVRRQRITRNYLHNTLSDLRKIEAISLDVLTNEYAWSETLALADRHGLTVYDAAYLELALRRGLPLATLDMQLADAARAEGVAVLP